jgi:hypothetical protein
MKELSLSFGHFKREDELPLTITVNGCTYQSQPLVDATKKTYFEMGKAVGIEEGKKSNGYSSDDIKKLHTDMNHIHHLWYDKGYNAGKKSNGYTSDDIKQLHTYAKGKEEGYGDGYNDGYEQCKHDGISKKEIPGEYLSHMEEARKQGYADGYKDCREIVEHILKYGRHEDGVAE